MRILVMYENEAEREQADNLAKVLVQIGPTLASNAEIRLLVTRWALWRRRRYWCKPLCWKPSQLRCVSRQFDVPDDIDALVDWQLSQPHSEEFFVWRCSFCRTTWEAAEPIRGCCSYGVLEIRCDDGQFRKVRDA
jgi:hypothetical protein